MADPSPYDEKDILSKIALGDVAGFTVIFNNYWPRLFAAALIIGKSVGIAEDTVREVFARFWDNRRRAAEIKDIRLYLFTATRSLLLNRLSRLKTEEAYQNYLSGKSRQAIAHNGEQAEYEEMDLLVRRVVDGLPPQQQRAFRLSREDGLTYDQIAAVMHISGETVKDYIVKALATLRIAVQ